VSTAALFDIRGKVALVSGASGALGSAVARGLADAGARVMLTGRETSRLTPLAEAIARDGGCAAVAAGDPTDLDAVRGVVGASVRELGELDILVTAAGMNAPGPIIDQEPDEWDAVVDSQLKTTWLLCKEAGRAMIEAGRGGKVVLVGSQRGERGMANYSAYCPAKAAVHLLARSLACEWGPHDIQVNCLAPGLFRSDLTAWMWDDREVSTRMLARVPHGRLGEPADFVGPVIFLASAASDWMTGAILHVDGGYTAG
jgi:NAD(P)-dependent dehydrogenase (short-subunit alcohol dehydrogenase family)